MFVGAAIGAILRLSPEELQALQQLLPKSSLEKSYWIAVSLTGGFCEEVLYRGYLFKQARAVTGSLAVALVFQAGMYAIAHVTLPLKIVASVSVLGLFLGGLASWRKSLVPGMIAHSGISLVGGLFSSM